MWVATAGSQLSNSKQPSSTGAALRLSHQKQGFRWLFQKRKLCHYLTSADRWPKWKDGIMGQVQISCGVEIYGDPVCLARRQSRVARKDPQPPMSNDFHRLPEPELRAYNMATSSTVLLNKTPSLKMPIPVGVLLWPSFSGRDPVKKRQERLGRSTSDDRPPELEHYLPLTLLL